MTTLRRCIDAFHEAEAAGFGGRPVRIIRVACLRTRAWRADADRTRPPHSVVFGSTGRVTTFRDRIGDRCAALAATGEAWELERVGLVVEDGGAAS